MSCQMKYLSLPLKTVWPPDHRSKDWSRSYDIRWKHKTSDQHFQEGLNVEFLRGKLCTKGAGEKRVSSDSWGLQRSAAILTDKITTPHASHKYIQPLWYQWLVYSKIHATSIISYLQLEKTKLSTSWMLIIFSNFQTAFICNLYCFFSPYVLFTPDLISWHNF